MSRPAGDGRRGVGHGVPLPVVWLGPTIERANPRVFRLLRRWLPVVKTPGLAVVAKDRDVRQVLARRDDFTVNHLGPKIMNVTGPFPLGLDADAHHGPALQTILDALRPADLPALAERAAALANEALDSTSRRTIDVLADFADPVLGRLVSEYLGVTGLDWRTMVSWSHTIFTEIFVSQVPYVRDPAREVVDQFRAHLDGLVAARRAAPTADDDALNRLLAKPDLTDDAVSRTLLGLVVAWIPNSCKTLALAVDELLDRPLELAASQQAARLGRTDAVAGALFEAVRFRPQTPFVQRVAAAPARVGLAGRSPVTIPAGAKVWALTASAMMDPGAVDGPHMFRTDRPWNEYLHFGYGLHTCAGMAISRATLPELLQVLLARGRGPLTRAGRMRWHYPYPSSLAVRFSR